MKRIVLRTLPIVLVAFFLAAPAPRGWAQPEVSIVHLDDPTYELIFYPIKEGIVKSDRVKLKFVAMSVAAQLGVLGTKQYDMVGTASVSVPRLIKRGLEAKIAVLGTLPRYEGYGIFVRKDSPITKVSDLKGKRLAVHALGAGNVVQMKIVLNEKHKLNTARVGGDLELVEVPPLQIAALLDGGRIDAGFGFLIGFYQMNRNANLRLLVKNAEEYGETFGSMAPVEAYIVFSDRLKTKPEAIREAQRLMYESTKYYRANFDAIARATAAKYRLDEAYLRWWFDKGSEVPLTLEDKLVDALDRFYQLAYKIGELDYSPNTREMIWKGYWETPRS